LSPAPGRRSKPATERLGSDPREAQIEHIRAVQIADEIYAVPGIDAIFIGPNDLTYSMRSADGAMPSKELFEGTLARILQAAQRHRVPCGLHVLTAEDALRRAQQGFQFIAVGSELKFMLDGSADAIGKINPDKAEKDLAKY